MRPIRFPVWTLLLVPALLLCAGPAPSSAQAAETDRESRRERIRYATNRGILSVYDIPFPVYAALGMWEEIDFILNANQRTALRHQLPGRFYSRPYAVGNQIWVFENSGREGAGAAHLFDPDSLRIIRTLAPPAPGGRPGGIRAVYRDRILSGGADRDVDAALIWELENGRAREVRLDQGHYVSALAADGDRIFAGACGGRVEAWGSADLSRKTVYTTGEGDVPADWAAFNRMPCIGALAFFNDHLVGVGDRRVFVWELETGRRIRAFDRALPGGDVHVFEGSLFEFRGRRITARPLERPGRVRSTEAEAPVADLIVTRERLLREQTGPVAAAALRGDRGMVFLSPDTLDPVRRADLRGNALAAFDGRLFATDDRFLYRYDLRHQASEKYDAFLETIDLSAVEMDPETYRALLQRARRYPEAIPPSAVGGRYLESRNIDLFHGFRYGRIGERTVRPEAGPPYQEDVFGYTLAYELRSRSASGVHLTLMFEWSGAYGVESPSNAVSSHWENLFLPPGERLTGRFVVGEKEPIRLHIFPVKLETASDAYVTGFRRAMDRENRDLALVRKYLADARLTHWHADLTVQRRRLERATVSWLDRLFR